MTPNQGLQFAEFVKNRCGALALKGRSRDRECLALYLGGAQALRMMHGDNAGKLLLAQAGMLVSTRGYAGVLDIITHHNVEPATDPSHKPSWAEAEGR